jgi:hypothetical protein
MLCRNCFFRWYQSFHSGKYGEIETIIWRCNIRPGSPIVLKLVKDKGITIERRSAEVTVCSDYSPVEWELEPFKLQEV